MHSIATNKPVTKSMLSGSRTIATSSYKAKATPAAVNTDDCLTWQEASKNLLEKLTGHYKVDFTYLGNAL